jgi:hypothetical protein
MSEQLQLRRGNAAAIAANAGALGEVFVDTDNLRLVLQDGSTVGGFPAAKLSEVVTNARTAISDAGYTAAATDRLIAYTALSAARTVTLPAASAYPTGTKLTVIDESGNCSATNTITLARAGSDTINGGTSAVIATAYGYVALESNGSSKWTVVDEPPGSRSRALSPAAGGSGVSATATPYVLKATGVNANSVADTTIAIPLPSGLTKYRVLNVTALNPSTSLTAAYGALYTASGGGGVAVCSPQALSGLTTNAANSAGNALDLALALAGATFFTASTLYFRITTAQGSAATVDVSIKIQPYE